MINLHVTSQASFREKRMVFELDSRPGDALDSDREFNSIVNAIQAQFNGHAKSPAANKLSADDTTIPELFAVGNNQQLSAEISGAIDAIAETHLAVARLSTNPPSVQTPADPNIPLTSLGKLPTADTTVDDHDFANIIAGFPPAATNKPIERLSQFHVLRPPFNLQIPPPQ